MNSESIENIGFKPATPVQIEKIKQICNSGNIVSVTQFDTIYTGRIVQYLNLTPDTLTFYFVFFLRTEETKELLEFKWLNISKISWTNDKLVTIKSQIARALELPQPKYATEELLETLSKTDTKIYNLQQVFDSIDGTCDLILRSRMISFMLNTEQHEKALELYNVIRIKKMSPFFLNCYYDFSIAILELVKFGIITSVIQPENVTVSSVDSDGEVFQREINASVDYQRGFGFAMRETQKQNLEVLLRAKIISHEDICKANILRQHPIVKKLSIQLEYDFSN